MDSNRCARNIRDVMGCRKWPLWYCGLHNHGTLLVTRTVSKLDSSEIGDSAPFASYTDYGL